MQRAGLGSGPFETLEMLATAGLWYFSIKVLVGKTLFSKGIEMTSDGIID